MRLSVSCHESLRIQNSIAMHCVNLVTGANLLTPGDAVKRIGLSNQDFLPGSSAGSWHIQFRLNPLGLSLASPGRFEAHFIRPTVCVETS